MIQGFVECPNATCQQAQLPLQATTDLVAALVQPERQGAQPVRTLYLKPLRASIEGCSGNSLCSQPSRLVEGGRVVMMMPLNSDIESRANGGERSPQVLSL